MTNEQQDNMASSTARPQMTAAERYAYKSLPENLRRRKESVEETIDRIIDFLALLKEFGEELVVIGYADYTPEPTGAFDPEHVMQREQILGHEFAGELQALEIFDQIHHEGIRRESGRLGKDFVKKVTQLQQLMESIAVRFDTTMLPFTRSKAPDLAKFEKELRQRISDISYLTRQHAELVASAQDAIVGDQEETNEEIEAEYQRIIMPYVEEYEAMRDEYGSLSRLSFRRRKELLEELEKRAEAIRNINSQYSHYTFIDFIAFKVPDEQ